MVRSHIVLIGFLAMYCWAAEADPEYIIYKDPKQPVNARIKDLMSQMTLEEKIGQMAQLDRRVTTFDVMKNFFIGKYIKM